MRPIDIERCNDIVFIDRQFLLEEKIMYIDVTDVGNRKVAIGHMDDIYSSRQPYSWPAALNWSDALAYTSISPTQLRRSEQAGDIIFKRVGRYGSKVASRADLDKLLVKLFGAVALNIVEDFDFG